MEKHMQMNILVLWLINTLIILVAAYLLPGIHIENFLTALAVALILGILNALLKPLLIILTLPITILTLGLFLLVINALLIMLTSLIVPGFYVEGFWWAVLFSILVSFLHYFFSRLRV